MSCFEFNLVTTWTLWITKKKHWYKIINTSSEGVGLVTDLSIHPGYIMQNLNLK
jgi:hypothetical protein